MSEILSDLEASDLAEELEVAVVVDLGSDDSVPLDSLELDVGGVLLELEIGQSFVEVDVGPLQGVHVLAGHLELIEVVVLGENFH